MGGVGVRPQGCLCPLDGGQCLKCILLEDLVSHRPELERTFVLQPSFSKQVSWNSVVSPGGTFECGGQAAKPPFREMSPFIESKLVAFCWDFLLLGLLTASLLCCPG